MITIQEIDVVLSELIEVDILEQMRKSEHFALTLCSKMPQSSIVTSCKCCTLCEEILRQYLTFLITVVHTGKRQFSACYNKRGT